MNLIDNPFPFTDEEIMRCHDAELSKKCFVENYRSFGLTKEQTMEKFSRRFGTDPYTTEDFVNDYWDDNGEIEDERSC